MADGLTDTGDIAQFFASRYRDVYTSVPYNIYEMHVKDAVSRLKPHKSEGNSELAADYFLNGGHDCLSLVAFLLTANTVHDHVPDSFRRFTIVTIPKGHNIHKSDSANFRGIEDITISKHSFIGQVNNTLCYFGKLSSIVKYNLFHAYCNYGCEL